MFKPQRINIGQIHWLSSSLRFYDEGIAVVETEEDGCIALDSPVQTYPFERVAVGALKLTREEFQARFPSVPRYWQKAAA